jgi:hypothetical protein
MEARVTALESAVGEILAELRAMRQDMTSLKQNVADLTSTTRKMELDLARMDGRVSQMPTLLQLITVVVAIWGMAFATLRFAGMH